VAFWEEFEDRFGKVGRRPASYWSYEIGHILHVGPKEIGYVTPGDLMGAMDLFDHQYRNG
jgi:hypothetical protein